MVKYGSLQSLDPTVLDNEIIQEVTKDKIDPFQDSIVCKLVYLDQMFSIYEKKKYLEEFRHLKFDIDDTAEDKVQSLIDFFQHK